MTRDSGTPSPWGSLRNVSFLEMSAAWTSLAKDLELSFLQGNARHGGPGQRQWLAPASGGGGSGEEWREVEVRRFCV